MIGLLSEVAFNCAQRLVQQIVGREPRSRVSQNVFIEFTVGATARPRQLKRSALCWVGESGEGLSVSAFAKRHSRSVGQFGLILIHHTTGGIASVRKMSNLWTKRAFAGLTYSRLMVAGLALVAVLASPAHAQNDRMTPIATPSQPNAVELGTGPLPNAKNPES